MSKLAFAPRVADADPEELAFRALGFIADRPGTFRRFLAVNGLTEAELLRLPIRRKHFAQVLTFLLSDELLLTSFSRQTDLPIEEIHDARRDLYRVTFTPSPITPDRR